MCGAWGGILCLIHDIQLHSTDLSAAFLFLGEKAASQAFLHLEQEGFSN